MESINDIIEAYDSPEGKFPVSKLKELLKELRKSKLRRPDIVFENWMTVLNSESGNEVWNVYEQICVAALDTGDASLANECIGLLLKKFPDSSRVGRLLGMQKEQAGEYEAALEIYADLLKKNPANLMVMKRKICIYKAKGDVKREVEQLNALLRQYPAEVSSWQELGELYLTQGDNMAAAHCFEELVLLSPGSAPHHCRLAEVYYTIGGFDMYTQARKHYALSLQNQCAKHNLRALYGVLYAARAAAEAASADSSADMKREREHELRVNAEMLRWATEQLQALRNDTSNSCLNVVYSAIIS